MEVTSPELEELRYGVRRYLSIRSSYAPNFSPDDKRIAYLSDITGVPGLWSVGLEEGAWPQQLSLGRDRVGFLSYAKKNDMIAYGVDSGGNEKFQIQVIEEGGERMGMVTDDPETIHGWGDWSPDERSICYSSNARSRSFFDIYVHSLDTGNPELIYQQDGNNFPVSWSPDGSTVMFERADAPFNQDLFLLRLADRSVERITPHDGDAAYYSPRFDPTGRFVYCVTDEGREFSAIAKIDVQERSLSYLHTEDHEVESLALSRDGNRIAFTVNEDGYSRLMVWRVGSESPEKVDVPRSVLGGLSWSNDGKKLAFSLSSSRANSDVWLYEVASQSVRRITHSSTCGIPETSFAEAEPFRFKSFDGLDVPAFLYRPKATEPSPLLVYLHGGPESQFRPSFNPLLQFFVRMGFAVVAPNFRGSVGYGRRYTHLDDVRGRMDTVKDAIGSVAEAQKMVPIDPRKVVAWGGSYGGFMVLACLYTKPDMWAAGVDIVGISNFVTFLKNTSPWRRKLRIPEYGDPEKDREFLESISPTNNAQYITTPLFIIHGTNDPRVPIGEAGQIMETMQRLGRESHIMTFDDEGHGLVKLENRIDGYTNAVSFLMYEVTVAGQGPLRSPRQDPPR
jgi:dipeptidyl aminopeptidase/acylaminoacyl peptidase